MGLANGAGVLARCASLCISPTAAPRSKAKATATGPGVLTAGWTVTLPHCGLERANGQVTPLPSKVPHTQVKTGDRFVCIGPAGGGYGQPFARDPQRVLDDVL